MEDLLKDKGGHPVMVGLTNLVVSGSRNSHDVCLHTSEWHPVVALLGYWAYHVCMPNFCKGESILNLLHILNTIHFASEKITSNICYADS